MSDPAPATVRVTRRFAVSAERVFDAWLDAGLMARWLFATPTGQMVRAEADPRVGGRFVFVDRRDGVDVEHAGRYLEIDRPRRIVFEFAVPLYSPDVTRVTVDISSASEGCSLSLTHEGVAPDWRSRTQEGWTGILEGLAWSLG
jgi:uncharacterized protein YndB with AHSA1/START domain